MNWTGWDVGKNGVRGVPRNASHLYNWGKGSGSITVEEHFAPGEEDLETEEIQRLRGNSRSSTREYLENGFSIIKPTHHEASSNESESPFMEHEPAQKENKIYIGISFSNGSHRTL